MVCGLLLATAIGAVALMDLGGLRRQALGAALDRAQTIAMLLADQAERSFEEVDLMQQDLLADFKAQGIPGADAFRQAMSGHAMHEELRARAGSLRQVAALAIHDAGAMVINSSRIWPVVPLDAARRDFTKTLRANPGIGTFISEPVVNVTAGKWTLFVARRVNGPGELYLGAVVAAIELAYFERLYQAVSIGLDTTISLRRQDGTLLARFPGSPAEIGRPTLAPHPLGPRPEAAAATGIVATHRLTRYPLEVTVETHVAAALAPWAREATVRGIGVVVLELLVVLAVLAMLRQSRAGRRVAEARAGTAEALAALEAMTEAMPGVLIRRALRDDGSFRVTYVSPTVIDMTGYTQAEAMRPGWGRLAVSDEDLLRGLRCEQQARTEGEASMEMGFRHRDGRPRRFHAQMRRNTRRADRLEVITVWTDVTREQALRDEVDRSARLAQLGEIVTGMAHELNQPLGVISMAAENAQRELSRMADPSPRLQRRMDVVLKMVARAAGVIDRMRMFGRTGTDPVGPVDLAAVIADAAALATARLREHRVALRTELAPDLPPVLAKAVPLELVLLHLITNACDAYGVHGVAVAADRVIRVRAEAAGGRIVIGVSDLAGGIPEGDLTNIFQPFFTTRTVGLGTGLGLSVSFGIITELGGTITAANLDGGAEFRIVLPAAGAA